MPRIFVFLLISSIAFAQGRGGGGGGARSGGAAHSTVRSNSSFSPGGFGSVSYPGTGRAPSTQVPGAITNTGFGTALGNSVRGVPQGGGRRGYYRNNSVGFPIFYGGGFYGYNDLPPGGGYPPPYEAGYGEGSPQQSSPVVIINQNFRSEPLNPVMHDYSDGNLPAGVPQIGGPPQTGMTLHESPTTPYAGVNSAQPGGFDQPTIYLLAFRDHTILPALAYWLDGDTLNYITQDSVHNRVTLDLIDRDLSKRLNDERRVEFHLPR